MRAVARGLEANLYNIPHTPTPTNDGITAADAFRDLNGLPYDHKSTIIQAVLQQLDARVLGDFYTHFETDTRSLWDTYPSIVAYLPLIRELGSYGLLPRQMQILEMMHRGYRNKQIATELAISKNTVKAHQKRIRQEMSVHFDDRLTDVTLALIYRKAQEMLEGIEIYEVPLKGDSVGSRLLRESLQSYGLTPREMVVLEMMYNGRNSKKIATEFVISNNTAKTHQTRIRSKIGAKDARQSALFYRDILTEVTKISHQALEAANEGGESVYYAALETEAMELRTKNAELEARLADLEARYHLAG